MAPFRCIGWLPFQRSSSHILPPEDLSPSPSSSSHPEHKPLQADMEPNTSHPPATQSTSAIIEQALSFMHAQSLHSPPSQSLLSACVSGFRSPAVGVGSVSVHRHVTSSQRLPSAFFPALQAPAGSPFWTPLGGQPWQGMEMPSYPVPVAELDQITARPESLMPFLSLLTGSGGMPPRTVDQLSSHYELPPLPESLRIPSLEEASTYSITGGTIDGSMPWYCVESSLDIGSSIFSSVAPISPSSRGAGASSNFIGFAQPSSHTELAPLPGSLQTPLLLVNQKPIDAIATVRVRDEDDVPQPTPYNSTARALSCETALKLPVESTYKYNINSTRVAKSTPCHEKSSSVNVDSSSSSPKLLQQPIPPSSLTAGPSGSRSRSRSHSHVAARVIFSDPEKKIIKKDKNLQELVKTNPKKAKRNISSRISAAKRKAANDKYTLELKCKVQTLQSEYNALSAELESLQERCGELEAGNKELRMTIKDMEQLSMLKDAENERLKAELKGMMHIYQDQRK